MKQKLYNLVSKTYNLGLHLLSPPFCSYCRVFLPEREVFCSDCFSYIRPIVSYDIEITKKYTVTVFAVSDYQEPLKSLILAKGHGNQLAACQLGQLLAQRKYIKKSLVDYIVPIPLHWRRYAWRGFNQAEQMAKVLSKQCEIPMAKLLTRRRKTLFQSGLIKEKRQQNVKNAFRLKNGNLNKYKNTHLVIVDDLMTTGSTLKSAAQELIKLKPASLSAAVACRVV